VLEHGGMPVVVEHYQEARQGVVVPLREEHHDHPA
jgi:hypothetical protein